MSDPNSNDERRPTDAEVASMKEQALRTLSHHKQDYA
jgi:hypothetical protein